ncbi:MAG: hypothetical protein IJ679_11905 [Lachnospiraceae bacterium]|nr:hypothetical protein [Lachnospiraceae bacterium]
MKKRFGALLMIAMFLVVSLGGCMSYGAVLDTTKSNKTVAMSMTMWFDKEAIDSLSEESLKEMLGEEAGDVGDIFEDGSLDQIKSLPVEVVDGRECYAMTETDKQKYNPKTPKDGLLMRKDSFYAASVADSVDLDDDTKEFLESGMLGKMSFTVKFAKKIKTTNGKLSKNKKEVTFEYTAAKLMKLMDSKKAKDEIYAYTVSSKDTLKADRALVEKDAKTKKKK